MSDTWEDFDDIKSSNSSKPGTNTQDAGGENSIQGNQPAVSCDWGQTRTHGGDLDHEEESSSKFIAIYEQYLKDKKSIPKQTLNYKTFVRNPQKELREWFANVSESDIEFKPQTEQTDTDQFACSLELPVDDHDFTLTSDLHDGRKDAIDEVCLDACRMLDHCELLYVGQSAAVGQEEEEELERVKRVNEAMKEDDIVFDQTSEQTKKKHCIGTSTDSKATRTSSSGVNTYDSLMARWSELNMSILSLKAKLVKLDLSVTKQNDKSHVNNGDIDDEVDPLDDFMSTINTKTKLSMNDKIEKSRIKSQIAGYEKEQSECARLIEIAKPSSGSSSARR